jgi:arylsulfatase A-like enzyme
MIQALDTEIGRLLTHVDLGNTLVIYLGDNGTPADVKDEGSKVRGSKVSTWEGGAKVPLTVAGAGVTRTGRDASLVNGTDIFATIAAASGINVRHVNDSYNLAPLFTDAKAKSGREFALTEICARTLARFAVRDQDYKLIYDSKDGWGLYNLARDQGEQKNLYDARKKRIKTEKARLLAALDGFKTTRGCFHDPDEKQP